MRKTVTLKLLSQPTSNYKSNKNIKLGYHTYFLRLAHSDLSGYNVCPMANRLTKKESNKNKSNCSSVCVAYNGNAQRFPKIMEARIRKTKLFYENRQQFMDILIKDIFKAIEFSKEHQKICTFRLNAYSDIQWEKIAVNYNNKDYKNIFELFSEYKFYDYTKIGGRKTPANYELTYSYYGNKKAFNEVLKTNQNIAVVFDKLPSEFEGRKVVNADNTDLRLVDNDGLKVIAGLKFKGSKKALNNAISEGFAIKI